MQRKRLQGQEATTLAGFSGQGQEEGTTTIYSLVNIKHLDRYAKEQH